MAIATLASNLKTMKTIKRSLFALAMGGILVSQSGCFGTFALTRKTYEFHDNLTDNKFVKSLLFWIPGGIVYGVVAFLDAVIFNLIEFWSGSNPLSMNEGDHEMQLLTLKGEDYKVEATKDTFTTTQLTGAEKGTVRIMRFDRCDNTWKYSDADVCDRAVMTFLDDRAENVRVYTDNGSVDMAAAELTDSDALMARFGAPVSGDAMCAK
jgi:hypothetical protein